MSKHICDKCNQPMQWHVAKSRPRRYVCIPCDAKAALRRFEAHTRREELKAMPLEELAKRKGYACHILLTAAGWKAPIAQFTTAAAARRYLTRTKTWRPR